jgi:hypothetical protein
MNDDLKKAYEILGVHEDASPQEVRDAYVELTEPYIKSFRDSQKDNFNEINNAYNIILINIYGGDLKKIDGHYKLINSLYGGSLAKFVFWFGIILIIVGIFLFNKYFLIAVVLLIFGLSLCIWPYPNSPSPWNYISYFVLTKKPKIRKNKNNL